MTATRVRVFDARTAWLASGDLQTIWGGLGWERYSCKISYRRSRAASLQRLVLPSPPCP